MSLEIKKLPKSEIEIIGEIPAEEFSKFWPKAVSEMSKNISLPGFRPGHVPEKILVDKIGEREILEKAGELALQEMYPGILEKRKIEAIGMPRASITKIAKGEALGFKFQTAVLPDFSLPEDFKDIAKKVFEKKEEVGVEDKEVDDFIEYIKKIKEKNPDNKKLPEINDDLRNTIRKNLQAEKEVKQKEKQRLQALDEILKKIEIDVPDVLAESEKKKMLSRLKDSITGTGLKWEDYLTHLKKKEEDILGGFKEDALKRVKYGLLLDKLAGELKIEIAEKEVLDSSYPKEYAYGIIRNEKIFSCLSQPL